MQSYTYTGFITYSHDDEEVARWLINFLETYKVPKGILGVTGSESLSSERRLGRFFRDRDESVAGSSLTAVISRAIENSHHLIVIASPRAARSEYVNQEIAYYLSVNCGRDCPGEILIFIISGDPYASRKGHLDQECLPISIINLPVEPLAADARRSGDGRGRAATKIISAIIGVGFDTLFRRERKRKIRNGIKIALVLCLLSGAIIYTVKRGRDAEIEFENASFVSKGRLDAASAQVQKIALDVRKSDPGNHDRIRANFLKMQSLLQDLPVDAGKDRYFEINRRILNALADAYSPSAEPKFWPKHPDGKFVSFKILNDMAAGQGNWTSEVLAPGMIWLSRAWRSEANRLDVSLAILQQLAECGNEEDIIAALNDLRASAKKRGHLLIAVQAAQKSYDLLSETSSDCDSLSKLSDAAEGLGDLYAEAKMQDKARSFYRSALSNLDKIKNDNNDGSKEEIACDGFYQDISDFNDRISALKIKIKN